MSGTTASTIPKNPAIYVRTQQRASSWFNVLAIRRYHRKPSSALFAPRSRRSIPNGRFRYSNMDALMSEVGVSGRRLSLNMSEASRDRALLAATGIYGVVSPTAQQRTREFGIGWHSARNPPSVLGLSSSGIAAGGHRGVARLAGALALGGVLARAALRHRTERPGDACGGVRGTDRRGARRVLPAGASCGEDQSGDDPERRIATRVPRARRVPYNVPMRKVISCLAVVCAAAAIVNAQDWPQWRGPLANGVSPTESTAQMERQGEHRWTALLAVGVSTPT